MSTLSLNKITIKKFIDAVNKNPSLADHILYHAQEWMDCSLVYDKEAVEYFINNGILTCGISDIPNSKLSSLKLSPFDYDDFSQLIELHKFLNYVGKTFNNKDSSLELIQHETNATVIVLKHCVIRFYDIKLYTKLCPLFKSQNPHIEKVFEHGIKVNYGYTISKKIIPIDLLIEQNKITKNIAEKIHDHMVIGLEHLHKIGFVHGDPSVNNSGYDPETHNFVLFDFDRSRPIEKNGDIENDYQKMYRSLKYKKLII